MSKVMVDHGRMQRGIGTSTARTALRLGDRVAVTGGNIDELREALADVAGERLLVIGPNACDQQTANETVHLTRQAFRQVNIQ